MTQSINKLFYNKWAFKIECRIAGAFLIGNYARKYLDQALKDNREFLIHGGVHVNLKEFNKFYEKVNNLPKDETKIRIEYNTVRIFCNNKDLVDTLSVDLKKWISSVSGPSTNKEFNYLNNNSKKVLCKSLPKNGFRYKAYLRSNVGIDERTSFITWIRKLNDVFEIPRSTEQWLEGRFIYHPNPYFYIKDEKTLAMVLLFMSKNIRKVEEFVIKDSISVV